MSLARRVYRAYHRHVFAADLTSAIIIAFLVIVGVHFGWGHQWIAPTMSGNRQVLYGALGQLAGALLGFVLAAASIILLIVPLPQFTLLRESKHYLTLFKTFFHAIAALGVTTVFAFIALLSDTETSPSIWISKALVVLVALSVIRTYRVVWVMWKVTSQAANTSTRPG